MITHVKFVSIPVKDQDRALKFYTEKLGFKVMTDQPMGDQRWIELGIAGGQTSIVLFTMEGEQSRIGTQMNLSLSCDDAAATYRQLSERGVAFEAPPKKEPWGTFVTMTDSEGNRMILSSR
jgi:predicted enzyme related to lactoylglutathione lyase